VSSEVSKDVTDHLSWAQVMHNPVNSIGAISIQLFASSKLFWGLLEHGHNQSDGFFDFFEVILDTLQAVKFVQLDIL
jgi:hypothetical protein